MSGHKKRKCSKCDCIKEMPSSQKFCSKTCAAQNKREHKIYLWLNGYEVLTTRGNTATAHWIRDYLLEKNNYKCSKCGWGEVNSYTGKVPLELEHIDGNFLNNSPDNLIILCPNCHALTSTYKGANKKGRPRAKYYRGS